MLPIQELFLDNYNRPGRKLKALKGIVIHWTANTNRGANALANRNYFNTKPRIFLRDANGQVRKNAQGEPRVVFASAHYIVDDQSIIQCLPDNEVGFHVGAPWRNYTHLAKKIMGMPQPRKDSPNNYLIGIEMCVNSDGDFEKTRQHTIDLTRFLMEKHGLSTDEIYRHFDITKKICPKMMVEDPKQWEAFLEAVQLTSPQTTIVPAIVEDVNMQSEAAQPLPQPNPVSNPAINAPKTVNRKNTAKKRSPILLTFFNKILRWLNLKLLITPKTSK